MQSDPTRWPSLTPRPARTFQPVVPGAGFEPACPFGQWCLRPSRLPVPPSGRARHSARRPRPCRPDHSCYVLSPPDGQTRRQLRPVRHPRRSLTFACVRVPRSGSQRPGMGRPWTDHPSWEVVDDASDAPAGTSPTCSSTRGRGADRDPQRPAGHLHLQPGGPRRRRAAGHRADRRGRPLRRRVQRPGRRRRPRLRGRRPGRRRARRGHAGRGRRPARRDGGGHRHATPTRSTSPAAWPTARCGWPTSTAPTRP